MNKKLTDIAWNVPEEVYREDLALSYSTIARYEKGGFGSLAKLFEPVESESLTFGSMVDTIMTEGPDRFNEKFVVMDVTPPSGISDIIKSLADANIGIEELDEIDDEEILAAAADWQPRYTAPTKLQKIKENGSAYFNAIQTSRGKTIVDRATYQEVLSTVGVLKNSLQTRKYFNESPDTERYYQLKFKTTLNGAQFRCMFDCLIVNYEKKWIMPLDLKTTGWPEYEFFKRYLECRYDIQSRLYWRILRKIMDEDEYFKDFKLYDFQFICVNKTSLWPLAWYDPLCKSAGEQVFTTKTNKVYILRDPEDIAKELRYYLNSSCKTPREITIEKPNNLLEWIEKM